MHNDNPMESIHQADQVMQDISRTYHIKNNNNMGIPNGPTDVYLGSQIPEHKYN